MKERVERGGAVSRVVRVVPAMSASMTGGMVS